MINAAPAQNDEENPQSQILANIIYSVLWANPICKHSQLKAVNGWFHSLATLRDSDTGTWRDVVVS